MWYFESQYAKDKWNAASKYRAEKLTFNQGSEHTIDGHQFDFEMHVNHVNKEE